MPTWVIAAAAVIAILYLLVQRGAAQARAINLSEGELRLCGWPVAATGYRILHLSDLHFLEGSVLGERVLALAEAARPDCVFVTGDLLTSGRRGAHEALEFLKDLGARWPTYVVPGNKDYSTRAKHHAVDSWEAPGVTVLRNAAMLVATGEARVWVVGVDDRYSKREDLRAALASVPADGVVLLLAHTPEIIRHPAAARAAAIFSGHTHGGQICLPGGRALFTNTHLPKELASGVHEIGRTNLVVSRGAGATRIRIRLNCPPEVSVWRILPKEA